MKEENKKILIVTYYWPPSGGSGVQRWLKFVKYLPSFGVEPHVYTPLNPDFNVKDESFLSEIPKEAIIIKRKIIEPYGMYRFFIGKKNAEGANFGMTNKKEGIIPKLAMWVRSNFFIPDPRVLWVKPSVKFLKKYIVENNIEKIITTGPPHSMHLIGLKLKEHFGDNLQWITDFRDPWTNIDFFKELTFSKNSLKKHYEFEKEVLEKSDIVITVGDTLAKELRDLGARNVNVITNGYDIEDIEKPERNKQFSIGHIGIISDARNPEILWKALSNFKKQVTENFTFYIVGTYSPSVKNSIEIYSLKNNVVIVGSVSHEEAVKFQYKISTLMLLINNSPNAKGILTGKFFEYMASQTPIIAIGPTDGDVAKILKETESGVIVDFEDEEALLEVFKKNYNNFTEGKKEIISKGYQKFYRKELTRELVKLIE